MKWEKPEVKELDVKMTANGLFNDTEEIWIVTNDKDRAPETKS